MANTEVVDLLSDSDDDGDHTAFISTPTNTPAATAAFGTNTDHTGGIDAIRARRLAKFQPTREGLAQNAVIDVDDLDSDQDLDVIVVGDSERVHSSKHGSNKSTQFIPFHLLSTAESKFSTSRLVRNNDAQTYFKGLRELMGLDYASPCGNSNQRKQRDFQWLVISNFYIDFSYLLQQILPEILQFKRVICFYGEAVDGDRGMNTWKELLSKINITDNVDRTVEFIRLLPSDPPQSKNNPLPVKIPYGVHHTKMFIMGYKDNSAEKNQQQQNGKIKSIEQSMIRVVVHTANLMVEDINFKTQGAYAQDFPVKENDAGSDDTDNDSKPSGYNTTNNPYKRKHSEVDDKSTQPQQTKHSQEKKSRGWPFEDDNPLPFEDDLVTYLESYCYLTRQTWCTSSGDDLNGLDQKPMSLTQLIRQYDYSNAYAVLIPSVPGRHLISNEDFGYLKLRKAIVEWVCNHDHEHCSANQSKSPSSSSTPRRAPVLCQFSSIGALTSKWLHQFSSAIDSASTHNSDLIKNAFVEKDQPPLSSKLRIVWPTCEEVRNSVEGYRGGATAPGTVKNIAKDFLVPLYHRWSGNYNGSNASSGSINNDPLKTAKYIPHIKMFVQPSYTIGSPTPSIEWMVMTSHNLSKAAWGEIQNSSSGHTSGKKVLFIRHWELGVFFSPATLQKKKLEKDKSKDDEQEGCGCNRIRLVPYTGKAVDCTLGTATTRASKDDSDGNSVTNVLVPIPFDLHPLQYNDDDVPWTVNGNNSLPDLFGRFGCY